jgi:hypothetical protein
MMDPVDFFAILAQCEQVTYSYQYAMPARIGPRPEATGPYELDAIWNAASKRLDDAGARIGLPMSNDPNGASAYWSFWVEPLY